MDGRKFNYRRDVRDHQAFFGARALTSPRRDRLARAVSQHTRTTLPTSANILSSCPELPVWDQGQFGSCTAHATCLAAFIVFYDSWTGVFEPSRLYAYNMTRLKARDSLLLDNGAFVFDACETMERARLASEDSFSYTNAQTLITKEPPLSAVLTSASAPWSANFDFVLLNPGSPSSTADLLPIKSALAEGLPVVFGFDVYNNAMRAAGTAPFLLRPASFGDRYLGGHCVCLVGYDDGFVDTNSGQVVGAFRARNSWAADWADGGDFYLSYAFVISNGATFDFYCLTA